jgi:hypothetical protein
LAAIHTASFSATIPAPDAGPTSSSETGPKAPELVIDCAVIGLVQILLICSYWISSDVIDCVVTGLVEMLLIVQLLD